LARIKNPFQQQHFKQCFGKLFCRKKCTVQHSIVKLPYHGGVSTPAAAPESGQVQLMISNNNIIFQQNIRRP
jgi:hypothetical protein